MLGPFSPQSIMYDAVTVLLREYWRTTGWNDQSSYLNLSKASDVLLDFAVPHGVSLSSLSISPEAAFTAHTRILTVPLSGTIAYSNARTNSPFNFKCVCDPLQRMTRAALFIEPDAGVPHSVFDPNKSREMLVYGGVHIPSACVEALCALRLSDDWQLLTTAFSRAPRYPMVPLGRLLGLIPPKRSGQVYPPPDMSVGPPGATNLLFTLQHQTPKTTAEYLYSLDDALWGARVLRQVHEFSRGGSLYSGAEIFFSAAEKSGGVSSGLRCTMPHGASFMFGGPKSGPAVWTMVLNPMMGYLRSDYVARVDDDLMIGTRFDLNAYSYQSDWTLGAEYILRRSPEEDTNEGPSSMRERVGVWVNPNSTSNVSLRDHELPPAPPTKPHQVSPQQSENPAEPESDAKALSSSEPSASTSMFLGLLKARLSMSGILSLLWEGHWRRCLVSVGLQSHLQSHAVSHLGVEIKYLSDTQG